MKYRTTKHFWEDYEKLPKDLKEKAKKAFSLFKENPRHSSFETHPIRGRGKRYPKVFEGYLDQGYRFTFHYEDDSVVFRRIGPHSIIDEEQKA